MEDNKKETTIYSVEWSNLYNTSLLYQQCVSIFFNTDEDTKVRDLRSALKDSELMYCALSVLEHMSEKIKNQLIEELIYVVIFGRDSFAYLSKQIIIGLDIHTLRAIISKIIYQYAATYKEDILLIKDLALLLYDLRCKKELLQYMDLYRNELVDSEFIENEKDTEDISNMKDCSDL